MTRRNNKSRITPAGRGGARRGLVTPGGPGLVVPGSSRPRRASTQITRERDCEGCKETHTEVWCQHHKRWELVGTEGEAPAAHG